MNVQARGQNAWRGNPNLRGSAMPNNDENFEGINPKGRPLSAVIPRSTEISGLRATCSLGAEMIANGRAAA
jgi:hypothetical protein